MAMHIGFQCPDNGIPIYGVWDEETGLLSFELEDKEWAAEFCPAEVIEEAENWCRRYSNRTFSSDDEANEYLQSIDVNDQLGVW